MKQVVKIIGGIYRGKNLPFPPIQDLRPTPQRVRETLFNWLMHEVKGAHVCDAFAGSGALGFEAFSRGAKEVVLLEKSPIAFKHLKHIAQDFKTNALEIIETDALHYLNKTSASFDIILLDPPFSQDFYTPLFELLAQSNALKSGGLLYVESPDFITPNATYFDCHRQKKAGQVVYSLYYKKLGAPSP